jgi:cell fate (sporulation/competence/biofilm development) regulator YmcA (YheA/YmcA/DUF963 family)
MDITIKKSMIVKIMKAIVSAPETEVEFESYQAVHDLSLNKKALQIHFDALKMLDRETVDFKKYQRQVAKLRTKFESQPEMLKTELNTLTMANESVIDAEIDRRDRFESEMDTDVTITNIRLIPLQSIKGKSGSALKFITDIEPLLSFDDEKNITKRPD